MFVTFRRTWLHGVAAFERNASLRRHFLIDIVVVFNYIVVQLDIESI
jgi:hypothetical protein